MTEEGKAMEVSKIRVANSEKFTVTQEGEWRQPEGKVYRCPVYLYQESEGGFSVVSANLPGVASQGDTEGEAIENITEALEGAFAVYKESGEEIPWLPCPREPDPGAVMHWVDAHG
jgi:predicted RNase H-like HicB family nuclease